MRALPIVIAGVLLCGATIGAVSTQLNSRHSGAPPKGPYVALGDSYTAGPGIPALTGTPAGCARSDNNYPSLVARDLGLGPAEFHDVSCSGATIADLSQQQSSDDGVNPAQLTALSGAVRLVTLGIGGNDIGFSQLLSQCVVSGLLNYATGLGASTPSDAPCRNQHVSGGSDDVTEKIRAAGKKLSTAVHEIMQRAPKARVYVVGYPAILPPSGTGCARELRLAPGDVTWLQQKEQQLDAMLRQEAQAAGAGFVDTWKPSVGHDACSAQGTRWIEPLLPRAPAAPLHPNARGERGMADAVLASLKGYSD